ncbi:MAG: helix-turn-helix transcriptional regulator [Clostridium sp.]|nr:helix-turn-helix transcriptional regulator [Clostridium sp.]MDU7085735.1 helix-turn-helix transcriptional regulator [Clostridium sp.]
MKELIVNAGNVIKNKRKAKGLSTLELAHILNISPGLLNNIENSKTDCFNLELLYSISNALDIPVTDIISYDISSILSEVNTLSELSHSVQEQLIILIKSLLIITNNPNWSPIKMALLLEKLNDEILFLNKLYSS